MTIHADYTQPCYTKYPNFNHPKLKKIFGITKYICKTAGDKFNIEPELNYNPLILEDKEKRITLVSATRLSKIKGGARMKKLAEELDLLGTNYIWYVFTDDADCIHSNNVIFLKPRLDVYKWIQEADYLVQLSDTEAMSYSISEALSYGKQVIITPLPFLNEVGIHDGENAIVLNFNCDNIKEVAERIKNPKRIHWSAPADSYDKYLIKTKSKYQERRKNMKRIRVKQKFLDMMHGNCMRRTGDTFIEDNDRADDLIKRGFAIELEDIPEQREKAVKPEPKAERAIKTEKEIAKKTEGKPKKTTGAKKDAPKE